jgi:hypothetical protein
MNSQIKTCQSLRYSWGLDDVAPEALLWIINVVLVFVALQGPTRSNPTPRSRCRRLAARQDRSWAIIDDLEP